MQLYFDGTLRDWKLSLKETDFGLKTAGRNLSLAECSMSHTKICGFCPPQRSPNVLSTLLKLRPPFPPPCPTCPLSSRQSIIWDPSVLSSKGVSPFPGNRWTETRWDLQEAICYHLTLLKAAAGTFLSTSNLEDDFTEQLAKEQTTLSPGGSPVLQFLPVRNRMCHT